MTVDYQLITQDATGNIFNIDAGSITDGAAPDTSRPFRNIRIAFESQFNTAAQGLSISDKAFENVNFNLAAVSKATAVSEFLRGTLLPADTRVGSLGATGRDVNTGIFQIDYYNKVGVGGYSEKIDGIANYFTRSSNFVSNGTTVIIDNVSLGVGRREDAFFVRNIDVSYTAVTPARS